MSRGHDGFAAQRWLGHCAQAGKREYPDRRTAKRAVKEVDPAMHAYRCDFCGFWHVGHGFGLTREKRREIANEKRNREENPWSSSSRAKSPWNAQTGAR